MHIGTTQVSSSHKAPMRTGLDFFLLGLLLISAHLYLNLSITALNIIYKYK